MTASRGDERDDLYSRLMAAASSGDHVMSMNILLREAAAALPPKLAEGATPRTDAVACAFLHDAPKPLKDHEEFVFAHFARQLERELAEAHRCAEEDGVRFEAALQAALSATTRHEPAGWLYTDKHTGALAFFLTERTEGQYRYGPYTCTPLYRVADSGTKP